METSTNRGMTENAGSPNMQDEMESLRNGFNKLRTDVAELFSHAFGVGRGGVEYARDYGTDTMDSLKQRYSDLRQRGEEQMHALEHRVEENPMQSALIAFGVGFLVAKILHRRH